MPLVAMGAYNRVIWVTRWANIPKGSFTCKVGYDTSGNDLVVAGEHIPKIWQSLWADVYEDHELNVQTAYHNLEVVVLDSSDAAKYLKRSRTSGWTVTVDLDFFTCSNPGKDGLEHLHGKCGVQLI